MIRQEDAVEIYKVLSVHNLISHESAFKLIYSSQKVKILHLNSTKLLLKCWYIVK